MGPDERTSAISVVYANRLQGLLLRDLGAIGATGPFVDELRSLWDDRVTAHIGVLADLRRLVATLEAAESTPVALKGAVLAELAYGDPGLRPYGDIDILVDASEFGGVVAALEDAGYDVIDANWGLITDEGRSQLHLRTPFGNVVDLHWHMFNRSVVRGAFDVKMAPLLDRVVDQDIGGVTIGVLDPEDTILYLSVNQALAGGRRLLQLVDLRYEIERNPPSWDIVVARAYEWRVEPLVWLSLMRARRLVRALVPTEVTAALQPGRARVGITRFVEHRRPYVRSTRQADPGELWSSSLRPTAWATSRALAGRGVRWIQNRVTNSVGAFEEGRTGGATRADYFSEVERIGNLR
jgi:hypothetical protein